MPIGAISLVLGTAPAQNAPVPVRAVHERTLYREVSGVALPYQAIPQRNPPCDGNRHVVVVDIDADGDLDLVIEPNGWRGIRIMLNDGDGRFVEETATRIPVPPVPVNAWRICVGDIDGDGDLDIAAGTDQGGYAPRYLQGLVYINDGTAHFSDESAARLPLYANYSFSLNSVTAMADFDRDGDLDLVLGGGFPQANYDRSIRLLRNDGRGYFTFDPSATPVDRGASTSVSGHFFEYDIDGDGDMDIVGNRLGAGIALWLNDGTGRFSDGRYTRFSIPPSFSSQNVRAGDVDADGDLDLVATRAYNWTVPYLYLNDGRGYFTDVSASHVDARGLGDVGLRMADFDADGDLDFLTTIQTNSYTYPGGENLFLNDGTGHFTLDVEQRMFPR
ncbi:MAG: VCBS repeat-containing protein, partial [Planctomycetes bacterium]|nr:VCBS repeat-containing protein [Planctomycetota bacterium]